jgi:hypothetical protein
MFIWGELLLLLFFVICHQINIFIFYQINLFICDHELCLFGVNLMIILLCICLTINIFRDKK